MATICQIAGRTRSGIPCRLSADVRAMKAKADSWKREPFVAGIAVPYRASFTSPQVERLSAGLVPREMEDKWFVYYEEPFLYLHRSWTGQPVFRVKLRASADGAQVEEALASEAPNQGCVDVEYQAQLLDFLVSNLLLGQSKPFPIPALKRILSLGGLLQSSCRG